MTIRNAVIRAVIVCVLGLYSGTYCWSQRLTLDVPPEQVEPESAATERPSPFYEEREIVPRQTTARRQSSLDTSSAEIEAAPPPRAKTPLPSTADFENDPAESKSTSRLGPSLFWVAGLLAIGWIARQCLKVTGPLQGRGTATLEVLSRQCIGPQQQLALIRLGSRVLLVGTTPSGMSTLASIDDPTEVAKFMQDLRPARSTPRPTWKDLFTAPTTETPSRSPMDALNLSTSRTSSSQESDVPRRSTPATSREVADV